MYIYIASYQANTWQGILFFILSSLAGWSIVSAWIMGLFAGTAGAVYVLAKVAESNNSNNRINSNGSNSSRTTYVQYNRPHYE